MQKIMNQSKLQERLEKASPDVRKYSLTANDNLRPRQGDISMWFVSENAALIGPVLAGSGENIQLAPGVTEGSRHCIKLPAGVNAHAPTEESYTFQLNFGKKILRSRFVAAPIIVGIKKGMQLEITHPKHANHIITFLSDGMLVTANQCDYATDELRRQRD
jgi:hypothetical protein